MQHVVFNFKSNIQILLFDRELRNHALSFICIIYCHIYVLVVFIEIILMPKSEVVKLSGIGGKRI